MNLVPTCTLILCWLIASNAASQLVSNEIEDDLPATSRDFEQDNENQVFETAKVHHSDEDKSEHENDVSEEKPENGNSSSSSYVIRMLSKAFRFLNLKRMVKNVQQGRSTPGACIACKFAMTMVRYLIDYGKGFKDVAYVTSYFCTSLNVQTPRVCEGYINNFMEEFVVVMAKVNLSANEICGTLLGDSCNLVTHKLHNWSLPLPDPPRFSKSLFFNSFRWPFRASQHFKVLQISDMHIDLEYTEKSNAVCGEPLCCRSSSPGSDGDVLPRHRAGYWGDYRDCDIPLRTVEETFRFIRDNHPDIDYIIWTGDIPAHDIWNQTRESQLELINIAGALFDKYFGHIPIYPVVGNHETLPMNSFPHPEMHGKYSKDWLYNRLSEIWLRWLPLETKLTIDKGAYFAARPKKGLKIISLNTNFCNNQNWWILLNSTDPGRQLEWLIEQLAESEELNEMVQIIGHVPPGSNDCIQMWSRNYNRIINRFAHIVKGQFFGHTHNDEFSIFYGDVTPSSDSHHEKTYRATNVAYVGPSITTFGNVNPGYRIYLVDEETFDIVDHETYFLNLTEANLYGDSLPLQFRHSYSAREAYDLKSLHPTEWHRLAMRMRTPIRSEDREGNAAKDADQLFKRFQGFFYNLSDDIGDENKCDNESCKYEQLCRLLTAISHDTTFCRHFLL